MTNQKIALNKNLLLPIFLGVVFSYISISCAINSHWGIFALSLVFALVSIFVILIQPLIIVFSKDTIKIIYTIGVKEIIPIRKIKYIYEQGNWFVGHSGWPVYVINYPQTHKKVFFMIGEIPRTRKVTKLLREFCDINK